MLANLADISQLLACYYNLLMSGKSDWNNCFFFNRLNYVAIRRREKRRRRENFSEICRTLFTFCAEQEARQESERNRVFFRNISHTISVLR